MYLRKKLKPIIRTEEINIINNGMKKYSKIKDFKLDIKKNVVYIYTVDNLILNGPIPKSLMCKFKQYVTELRFVLVDKEERTFEVERFCYKGSVDDWIFLDESKNLERLVKDYTQHLGKDSFYELV